MAHQMMPNGKKTFDKQKRTFMKQLRYCIPTSHPEVHLQISGH